MSTDELRAAKYADLFEGNHEHVADCAYCPVCTAISLVRRTNPEVLDHLAAAAREFMIAAGLLLSEAGERIGASDSKEPSGPRAAERTKVRRIDVG